LGIEVVNSFVITFIKMASDETPLPWYLSLSRCMISSCIADFEVMCFCDRIVLFSLLKEEGTPPFFFLYELVHESYLFFVAEDVSSVASRAPSLPFIFLSPFPQTSE